MGRGELEEAMIGSVIGSNRRMHWNTYIVHSGQQARKEAKRELAFVVTGMRCNILMLFTFSCEVRILNKFGAMQDLYSQDRLLTYFSFI